MKKITVITSHLGYGGIEQYLSSLCDMLKDNYEIELIVVYKKYQEPVFSFDKKIKIKYIFPYIAYPSNVIKYLKSFKLGKAIKEGILGASIVLTKRYKLIDIVRNLKTDIVLTTRLKESKYVNRYCSKNIYKICTEHNYPSNLYKLKLLTGISRFNKLVVVNEEIKKIYEKNFKDKVISISNVIEDIPLEKSKLKTNNLIAIGRLEKEKGYLDLIEVIGLVTKQIPDITLYLIGNGKEYKKITKKINKLDLNKNIIMTGYLNKKDISLYILNSSLMVMTSFKESFGIVLLEAMSYGVPVISFENSGSKELINGKNGLIIKNRNKKRMSKEIINLLNNKKDLKEYSKEGSKVLKKYDKEIIKKEWLKFLGDIK